LKIFGEGIVLGRQEKEEIPTAIGSGCDEGGRWL
jgi:hypothetical protein